MAEVVVIGAWTDADKGVGVGVGAGQQAPMESENIPPCPCLGVPNLIGVPSFLGVWFSPKGFLNKFCFAGDLSAILLILIVDDE